MMQQQGMEQRKGRPSTKEGSRFSGHPSLKAMVGFSGGAKNPSSSSRHWCRQYLQQQSLSSYTSIVKGCEVKCSSKSRRGISEDHRAILN
mmetsp:Transcript_31944/g.77836  ORF Transcript_31944/g.77836 Transcript_31944/m.77836 type:complete len:90 (-) Transcript_31944:452-721(-)